MSRCRPKARVAFFLRPSDGNAGKSGTNSDFASQGTTPFNCSNQKTSSGVFANGASYGIADTTDGTPNTIALSESVVSTNSTLGRKGGATGFPLGAGPGGASFDVPPGAARFRPASLPGSADRDDPGPFLFPGTALSVKIRRPRPSHPGATRDRGVVGVRLIGRAGEETAGRTARDGGPSRPRGGFPARP